MATSAPIEHCHGQLPSNFATRQRAARQITTIGNIYFGITDAAAPVPFGAPDRLLWIRFPASTRDPGDQCRLAAITGRSTLTADFPQSCHSRASLR
jgi:hypothetical protein